QAIIAGAIQLDKDDSRVRAAFAVLAQQAEDAARQARVRTLLEAAQNELSGRRYTGAIKLLREVEHIDPANPELISLLKAAESAREQEQRRQVVDQVQREIDLAVTLEQLLRAANLVEQSLKKLPADPNLLKFKSQLDRQVREAQTRRS